MDQKHQMLQMKANVLWRLQPEKRYEPSVCSSHYSRKTLTNALHI